MQFQLLALSWSFTHPATSQGPHVAGFQCHGRGAKVGHQHTRSFGWEGCDDGCIFLTPGSTWGLFCACLQTFTLCCFITGLNPHDIQIC